MTCRRCDGPLCIRREVEGPEVACLRCGWRPTRRAVKVLPEATDLQVTMTSSYARCHVSPSCFDCPLPKCILDDPVAARAHLTREVDRARLAVLEGSRSAMEAARTLGISARTLHRSAERAREVRA